MPLILKLFVQLGKGALFHFYDKPLRRFVKTDDKSALSISGHSDIHPHVLIFEDKTETIDLTKKEDE